MKQDIFFHGLDQEIDGAVLHRMHTHGNVALSGQKNHRQGDTGLRHALMQLKTVHAGHLDVEQYAARSGYGSPPQESVRRGKRFGVPAHRTQQARQTAQHGGIVIHHEYGRAVWFVAWMRHLLISFICRFHVGYTIWSAKLRPKKND
jgi:hypothetical protein